MRVMTILMIISILLLSRFHFMLLGLEKIKQWTQQSLNTRLKKSLSYDWIHESRAHTFPLKEYYVQLEWQEKKREAHGFSRVKMTSINEVIKHITSHNEGQTNPVSKISSVLIEGEFSRDLR